MSKVLGSWSAMRKYLEKEMLAESLSGRVRYNCTAYSGMGVCHIFEIYIDNILFKQFSLETVNTYFIKQGYKTNDIDLSGIREYWEGFQDLLDVYPMESRTEYTDDEFASALDTYRNQSIQESLDSLNPIVRMFAVFDRRVGKRTLEKKKDVVYLQPEWLQKIYNLRMEDSK